jgi:hypothetical protein
MAKGKRAGLPTLPGAVHVVIYTATTLGALWLSRVPKSLPWYLGAGMVILVSHWLIDSGDVAGRWIRLYRQSRIESVRIGVDQSLHLLVLAFIAWLAEGRA